MNTGGAEQKLAAQSRGRGKLEGEGLVWAFGLHEVLTQSDVSILEHLAAIAKVNHAKLHHHHTSGNVCHTNHRNNLVQNPIIHITHSIHNKFGAFALLQSIYK